MKKIILYTILLNLTLTQTVISGFITNEKTGEALIGANVFIPEMKIGITSDKNGFYSILIEETELKEFEIVIQYLGYNTINKMVNKNSQSIRLDFELLPANIKLKSN